MTIGLNQQVDFLWKKLGYCVAKTDVSSSKDATNEHIASAPYIPGDKIWVQADLIPSVLPAVTTGVVEVHSLTTSLVCVMDITATPYRTWLTNLTDWIMPIYGSTYQIQVFLALSGNSNPNSWHQLWSTGASNNDEWYFDYEAGVLNFIGDNLPTQSWSNHQIRICGGRYIGLKGLGALTSGTFGNLTLSGDTMSGTGNIYLAPNGNLYVSGATINNVGYTTVPTSAATVQYVNDSIASLHPNAIWQGDSIVAITDTAGLGGVLNVTLDGSLISTFTSSNVRLASLTITGSTISSTGNIGLTPALGSVVTVNSNTAFQVPTGDVASRPLGAQVGYVRYNTTFNNLEFFNGTDWLSVNPVIDSQVIVGDGHTLTFAMSHPSPAQNLILSINGVTQVPGIDYNTVGSYITFSEPPLGSEVVEIRYITQTVSAVANTPPSAIVDATPIPITLGPTVIDSFSAGIYRAAKYMISAVAANGDAELIDISVATNGNDVAFTIYGTDMTTQNGSVMSYHVDILSGTVVLTASSTTPGSSVKLHKTYFTV